MIPLRSGCSVDTVRSAKGWVALRIFDWTVAIAHLTNSIKNMGYSGDILSPVFYEPPGIVALFCGPFWRILNNLFSESVIVQSITCPIMMILSNQRSNIRDYQKYSKRTTNPFRCIWLQPVRLKDHFTFLWSQVHRASLAKSRWRCIIGALKAAVVPLNYSPPSLAWLASQSPKVTAPAGQLGANHRPLWAGECLGF